MEAKGNAGGRPADTSKAPTRSDLPSHDQREHRPLLYLLLFLALTAGIVAAGYLFYRNYERNFRAGVERELSSISELKVGQLVQWRKERMGDASVFYKNKAFSGLVRRFLEKPVDAEARGLILNWLGRVQGAYQCDRIFILDAQGIERLAVPEAPPAPVASHLLQQIPEVLRSDKITFLDFHRDAPDRPIHLSLAIPVREESDGGQPLGVLVLRIDPATYLYPYISAWPIPSLTAETLLIRRDGNDALFLNELKFQKDTALKLRVPLTSTDIPAVKAALGQEGIVEGIDYRGVPVLADMRGIPDSPWFLVVCMDTAEVLAPLRARLWLMIGLVAILLCGAGAGVGMIWRLQRVRFYRERYKATEAVRRAEENFRHSLDDAPLGVRIVSAEGETIYANRAILDIYGFSSLEELRTTPLKKRYTPESYAEFQKRYERRQRGEDSPSEYEVSIVRKNGEVRHLLVSRKVLLWNGKKQYQTICRDITERKRTEELLAQEQSLLHALMDNVPDQVYFKDADSRFIRISKAQAERFCLSDPAQAVGKTDFDVFTENHARPAFEDEQEIMKTGRPLVGLEEKETWPDGRTAWVSTTKVPLRDRQGRIIGTFGISRDITERKRAEEALRESEARYRTLFDESLDGICLADAETGLIIDCNQALAALVGRERAELIGQSQTILHPPYNDQTATSPTFRQHLGHKEGHTLETQVVTSAGIIREVEIKANRLNLQGRKTLQGVFRDITERKRAEEALRKSEEKYRGLTENVNLGIYRNTVGPEGKFIEANPTIIGMFGYKSKEEFLAINVSDLYQNPEDRNKFNDKMLKEGFVRGEELWLKKKDGSPFVGSVSAVAVKDEQGHVKYYDGIIDNITERKRAEEALKQADERLLLAIVAGGVGIWDLDVVNNKLTWDDQMFRLYGIAPDNFGGAYETWKARVHPEDVERGDAEVQMALRGEKEFDTEFRVVWPSGTIHHIRARARVHRDAAGQPTKLIGTNYDITERKRTEKVNAAVYKISEITNNAENLEELFASIHSIISELMPARNFYIALYDPETGLLSFPYHKDEYDEAPPPQPLRRGLTDYVLRQGEPLLADPVKFLELERSGEVESIGAPSIDWLGVPLKVKDKTIGVMVVQTYTEGVRYKEEDRDMLMFVSNQAAVAIERKRAEATLRASLREKEVLLREIHHRVKNNMQVISSLFNLQAGHTTNEECRGILKEGQTRIRSMSLVHEKLYQSRDLSKIGFADYIQSLVVHLFHSYLVKPDQVRFETDFEDVSLDINSAVPCGLILNELISNALKHAFPEGRTGVIKIGLRRGPGGAVELRVADDGVGFPKRLDFRKAESFGLQIVNLLVDQLEATIEIDRTKGTAFTVTFRELKYALRT